MKPDKNPDNKTWQDVTKQKLNAIVLEHKYKTNKILL